MRLNRVPVSDNPFEKIESQIENQKAVIAEVRKKLSETKDRLKKECGKLEDMEHQHIVEIVEHSGITPEMLKQLMLAAKADEIAAEADINDDYDRKEVETDEDEETE